MRRIHTYLIAVGFAMAAGGCNCSNGAVGSCANGQTCPANSVCDLADQLCFPTDGGGTGGSQGGSGGIQCLTGNCPAGYVCDSNTSMCVAIPGSDGGNGGATVVGYCPSGQGCPAGSFCSEGVCFSTNGGNGGSSNGSGAGSNGGTAGQTGGSNGSGSGGGTNGGVAVGPCNNGIPCPAGSVCDTSNWVCYAPASSGGQSGGNNGGVVTGECFDAGSVCPSGSLCESGICIGPANGGSNGGFGSTGAYWNGTGGNGVCQPGSVCAQDGGSPGPGQGIVGYCPDGTGCPAGSACVNKVCVEQIPPSGSGGYGYGNGGGSSGGGSGGCSGVTGCGQSCSQGNPLGCMANGLFCDPGTSTCQQPTLGEPCQASVGCQPFFGKPLQCVQSKQSANMFLCADVCQSSQDCSLLEEACLPSPTVVANTCQPNSCSDYFGTCPASGTSDGTCLLPPNLNFSNCPAAGCGVCLQGHENCSKPSICTNTGDACDQSRGTNFCEPALVDITDPGGQICAPAQNGGSNTACLPLCSPLNGPTFCPLGQACYWPPGQSQGYCVIPCPVDPLCPIGAGGGSDCGFCGNNGWAQAAEAFLCLGGCCITSCPGNLTCQFANGIPVPVCLP